MDTFASVDPVSRLVKDLRPHRTDLPACHTANTAVLHHQLRLWLKPLRIVAPTAVQAAALEKNYSPHAGPVMDAEMLNIKNIRFYAHFPVTHTSFDTL